MISASSTSPPICFLVTSKLNFAPNQEAFIAFPEKALLDLVHLTSNGDDPAYLAGLRLQNLERLDPQRLQALAGRAGKPKGLRAAARILTLIENEVSTYTTG